MSIAIHITTHASQAEVEEFIADLREIVADLTARTDEGKPPATWAIYGNDYSVEPAQLGIRIDEKVLAEDRRMADQLAESAADET